MMKGKPRYRLVPDGKEVFSRIPTIRRISWARPLETIANKFKQLGISGIVIVEEIHTDGKYHKSFVVDVDSKGNTNIRH